MVLSMLMTCHIRVQKKNRNAKNSFTEKISVREHLAFGILCKIWYNVQIQDLHY